MVDIHISINVPEGPVAERAAAPVPSSQRLASSTVADPVNLVRLQHEELVAQMGDEIGPMPGAKVGGYMSHFRITIRFNIDALRGKILSVVSPPAAQSVAWSDPFIYQGPAANHRVLVPTPARSSLPK